MDMNAAALVNAPLTVALASLGPAIGIGYMAGQFYQSVARQPEVQGNLTGPFFITLGVVELLGLFGFVAFYLAYNKVLGGLF